MARALVRRARWHKGPGAYWIDYRSLHTPARGVERIWMVTVDEFTAEWRRLRGPGAVIEAFGYNVDAPERWTYGANSGGSLAWVGEQLQAWVDYRQAASPDE